jgi:hypothetical protein
MHSVQVFQLKKSSSQYSMIQQKDHNSQHDHQLIELLQAEDSSKSMSSSHQVDILYPLLKNSIELLLLVVQVLVKALL